MDEIAKDDLRVFVFTDTRMGPGKLEMVCDLSMAIIIGVLIGVIL